MTNKKIKQLIPLQREEKLGKEQYFLEQNDLCGTEVLGTTVALALMEDDEILSVVKYYDDYRVAHFKVFNPNHEVLETFLRELREANEESPFMTDEDIPFKTDEEESK